MLESIPFASQLISIAGYGLVAYIIYFFVNFVRKSEQQNGGGITEFIKSDKVNIAVYISFAASFFQIFSLTASDPYVMKGGGLEYFTTFGVFAMISVSEAFFGMKAIINLNNIKFTRKDMGLIVPNIIKTSVNYLASWISTYTMLLLRISNVDVVDASLRSVNYMSVTVNSNKLPLLEYISFLNIDQNKTIVLSGTDLASCVLVLLSQIFIMAAAINGKK